MPTRQKQLTSLLVIIIVLGSVSNALAGYIVAWGPEGHGLVINTPTGNDFVDIAARGYHSLALKADGSIVSWGRDLDGQVRAARLIVEFQHYFAEKLEERIQSL